jgi:hypothetical protein
MPIQKAPLQFYTAQYRYKGEDRLDITVKGKHSLGRIFAPTWDMVMGLKEGRIDWLTYCGQYSELMLKSYGENRGKWEL